MPDATAAMASSGVVTKTTSDLSAASWIVPQASDPATISASPSADRLLLLAMAATG